MIKLGFSTSVCPAWNLDTVISKASTMGFDCVELRCLGGELNLPLVADLARSPDQVRKKFADQNVELVCLGSSATFDSKNRGKLARQKAELIETIELASALGCKFVRLFVGEVQRLDNSRIALARIAESIRGLIPLAARCNVTLLVENGGDFPSSESLWFVLDAANHPSIGACWNQCTAMTVGERATNSIPRLVSRMGIVHLCDAKFDERDTLLEYTEMGAGDVGVARQIELLKGLAYDQYLVFDWPKLWVDSLPTAESALPSAVKFMRDCIDDTQTLLSAYKGDKKAPNLGSRAKPEVIETKS